MQSKEVLILKELLAADGDFVSGNRIADMLGVSRVAIWGQMEKLREEGFAFEAVRSKGYRIVQAPERLSQAMIEASLTRSAETLSLVLLDEVDSTSSEAERRLANGEQGPLLIASRKQTAGRGRLGRSWHSAENGNLYMSFALRPEVSPARMSAFTLWMGVNICECLNAFCRLQSRIKWPNDILIGGKKVAGILTEARMDADQTRDVILGLGLNVNSESGDWPEALKPIATSLRHEAGKSFDINRLTAAVAGRCMLAYEQFLSGEHRMALKEKWPHYDALKGRQISFVQGKATISGKALGIDSQGALIIEREDGSHLQVRAGEITIGSNRLASDVSDH